MARLQIPEDFTSQFTLLTDVVAQNTALGAASPITAYLTQMDIDLADDVSAGNDAQTHEISRALLSKQSENYRQLRDNAFKKPWQILTGSAQFLKQFYKNNMKELGNWGFTITDGGKLNYPAAITDRIAVFTTFAQKVHTFTPTTNPLAPYFVQQEIDVTKAVTLVQQATVSNTSFTNAANQSENETELRNQLWLPVLEHLKDIGGFLMKLYSNNPKALGNWGFVVDDSPQKPKLRTTKIKPGATAVLNGLTIGGTLTNIGAGEVHLCRGKATVGNPTIIHAGEQFGIVKGHSTITIVNPSTLAEAKITVLTAA
ncbi:MAG: hypothetical protein ABJB05_05600 [Parafilimonas sp.]